MSVAVVIVSKNGVVAASDSQRISASGESEAPYNKTFKIGNLVGAYVGLLEFAGKNITAHISDAISDRDVDAREAVRVIGAHITPILEALPDTEVGFMHRGLDIIIGSKKLVASIRLAPTSDTKKIDATFNENSSWLTAGSDRSAAQARNILSKSKTTAIESYGKSRLGQLATSAIESAILVNETHPNRPNCASCCLPTNLKTL